MRVAIGIPFRDSPGRAEILDHLLRFLHTHLRWPVTLGDSGHELFNRAATRNQLVRETTADVIVLCDADTFVHPIPLQNAVTRAVTGGLHYPFTWAQNHTPLTALAEIEQLQFPRQAGYRATGGIYVVRPDQWWLFGGQDENFVGYGGEDDATFIAASTLTRVRRQPGTAIALQHEAVRKAADPHWVEAGRRMDVYRALNRRPELMRDFIHNRDELGPWEQYVQPQHRR